MLLLNFLSSASKLLRQGPIPTVHKKRKRKKPEDDTSDEEEQDEDEDMVMEGPTPRGTILVTLRNVVPYTQW